MSEWLCRICWIQTKTFHDFYKKVEVRHGHCGRSNDLDSHIKQEPWQERSGFQRDESLELDLNLVKYEETEPPAQTTELLISKEKNCKYNDWNDDKSCDESKFFSKI